MCTYFEKETDVAQISKDQVPKSWYMAQLFQVKLISEESCQRTNCKTKYKLENQNPLENNQANLT